MASKEAAAYEILAAASSAQFLALASVVTVAVDRGFRLPHPLSELP